jgi:subtilase family serine protease
MANFSIVIRPELIVSVLSNPPTGRAPGGIFTVTVTVRNTGNMDAVSSSNRFYLSLDETKSAADVRFSATRTVPGLPTGTDSTGSVTLTVPSTLPLGSYFLLACADDTFKVSEANETNNCRASTSRLLVARPDLVPTSVSNPPAARAPGATFSVTTSVRNQSQVTAGSSTLRFYLSLDATRNSGDVLLSGSRAVVALSAGATSTTSTTVTVPSTAQLGSYHVLACADDTLKVAESDENNCLSSAAKTLIARPNLTVTTVTKPPVTAIPGASFSVTDGVYNPSPVTSPESSTRYYLSLDALKDPTDVRLSGTRSVAKIAPGATLTGSRTVTVPLATPLGTYRLLACADDLAVIPEANEADNCMEASRAVMIARPDLVTTTVSSPPCRLVNRFPSATPS